MLEATLMFPIPYGRSRRITMATAQNRELIT